MYCLNRWGGRGCGRLMCAPVVVGEDVGAAHADANQKAQINQLFGVFEVGDGAGDF